MLATYTGMKHNGCSLFTSKYSTSSTCSLNLEWLLTYVCTCVTLQYINKGQECKTGIHMKSQTSQVFKYKFREWLFKCHITGFHCHILTSCLFLWRWWARSKLVVCASFLSRTTSASSSLLFCFWATRARARALLLLFKESLKNDEVSKR